MAGIIFVISGVILVLLAPIARLPRVRKWMEDELDAPSWRSFREGGWSWWRKAADAHYKASRQLLPILLAPLLLLIGLGMIISGIQNIS